MLYSGHATVWVVRFFGASPHRNFPGCRENSKGGLIREQYMFHIVHSPRFMLLAPLKLTFGIGMSDQRFGYSSPVVYIDPVELPTDSSGGNRRVENLLHLDYSVSDQLFTCDPESSESRMKFTVAFLVLSMVVFMAQPGEGFWRKHAVNCVKGVITGNGKQAVEQADQRMEQQDLVQQDEDQQQMEKSLFEHKALQRH
ncbi:hypothetical protein CRENBAI_022128 [Crenichthys baileyi]|uniref:Uncharacterized protein n=1 Tax=Crenichthys baileyi TaxID=28760 RepID=A0AAV9SB98_9TELE